MKSYKKMRNCVKFGGILVIFGAVLVLFCAETGNCQQYMSQNGRFFDANPRLGSFGLNTAVRLDALVPRANMYVTGNVTGGGSFQGVVPYSSVGSLGNISGGSGVLDNFRRDSVGAGQLSSGLQRPRYYVGAERAVTTSRNGGVWQTNRSYQSATSSGASARQGFYGQSNLVYRPLDSGFSLNNRRYESSGFGQVGSVGFAPGVQNSFDRSQGFSSEQWRLRQQNILSQQIPQEDEMEVAQPFKPGDVGQEAEGVGRKRLQPIVPLEVPEIAAPSVAVGDEQQPVDSGEKLPAGTFGSMSRTPALSVAKAGAASASISVGQSDFARGKINKYFSEGKRLMVEGKYYQAVTAFDLALIYGSTDAKLYQAKSYSLVGAGEFMSAAFYLDRAFKLSGETVIAIGGIKEFFPDAEQLQQQIAKINYWAKQSGNAMLSFLEVYMLYQSGESKAAQKVLTEAFEGKEQSGSVKFLVEAFQ